MVNFLSTKSIYYNDVNLIARPAKVKSRKDVPIELNRVIVSPMAAVVGETFSQAATELGLTVCQHKFCDIEKAVKNFNSVNNKDNLFVSIGLNDWTRAAELAYAGAENWLIDCANGYLPQINEVANQLIKKHNVKRLMIGNVMTSEGISLYQNLKLKVEELIIRVGIAGGCFIPESLVKTNIGYVEIQNIKIGDKVLTHTGEYSVVTNKFEEERDEELLEINGITCTKNHEFLVIHNRHKNLVNEHNYLQYAEWVAADQLTEEYFLVEL